MWLDVVELAEFYRSRVGLLARRVISRRLAEMWPDARGQRVLGLGYAIPYLRQYRETAERVLAVMPPRQGVMGWPPEGPGLTLLADEAELPLPDNCIDRVLLAHALEHSEQVRAMLREIWRVLAAGGRLIAVVPNRRGLWARIEGTPFGHGSPFSPPQLTRLLRETLFQPLASAACLYMPPLTYRWMRGASATVEQLAERCDAPFAGVLLVEAQKQIYAATPAYALPARRRRAYGLLIGRPALDGRARLVLAKQEHRLDAE
ncbi:MAG: class I SAM-dependent methyltransferase [Alphaproteobacteria bacterium]|nr:class I SAM-dependent methyltransferase [Alphaproteobacteria bacterium]